VKKGENTMRVNDRYTSFYYESDDDFGQLVIDPGKAVLLVIDMQNKFCARGSGENLSPRERREWERWQPFYDRLEQLVIPNLQQVLRLCREKEIEVIYARIACLKKDGRDRSLDHKATGFNQLLVPLGSRDGEVIDELKPKPDDIVVSKTTDSVLTGTSLRLILRNMDIETVIVTGLYTDQCVACSVRSLADESFDVILMEDCCIAATPELHDAELRAINNIYCHVVNIQELEDALE
jgi:nicotinamidase-related amidase